MIKSWKIKEVMRKVHMILIQKLKVTAMHQTLCNQPSQRHKQAHKVMNRNMYTGGIPLVPLIQDRDKRNKTKCNNAFKTFQQSV